MTGVEEVVGDGEVERRGVGLGSHGETDHFCGEEGVAETVGVDEESRGSVDGGSPVDQQFSEEGGENDGGSVGEGADGVVEHRHYVALAVMAEHLNLDRGGVGVYDSEVHAHADRVDGGRGRNEDCSVGDVLEGQTGGVEFVDYFIGSHNDE